MNVTHGAMACVSAAGVRSELGGTDRDDGGGPSPVAMRIDLYDPLD